MENEVVKEVIVDEEVVDVVEEEKKIVEPQQVLTEEEIRTQQTPKLNLEFCLANNINQDVINRFCEKIDFPDNLVDSCWLWNASTSHGYGRFRFGNSTYGAHRFSHMIFKGEISEGLCIRHTCNNTSCVNPYHLIAGTQQDNMDDMIGQNRQAKGEYNGNSKLTENEVDKILKQLLQKVSVNSLATQYEVCVDTVYKISTGKRWKRCYAKLTVEQKQKIKENLKKLSHDDTKRIRELYKTMNQVDLAVKFNVSAYIISKVLRRIPPYDY